MDTYRDWLLMSWNIVRREDLDAEDRIGSRDPCLVIKMMGWSMPCALGPKYPTAR